ncbi:cation diffusion facilitator family transporter [Cumulibacter soli]|uniref:cation diffusion facilitator family transporter n=1 Tax=Cumulibacter soli TaxID=2546344 RepID=UPI001ABBD98E|nr:cation diffusion facilitator family transporter [Cumulibacter soli]
MSSQEPPVRDLPPPKPKPAGTESSDSLLTVLVALTANALIAIAKSIVAAITGSASMVAEAAHSWSDTGNEVFLLVAERTSAKPADRRHPLGYGREAYVWSMIAAFGLFTAGSVLSIWHGITQLGRDESEANYTWTYVVLAVAFVLEGISFLQALRQTRGQARRRGMRSLRFVAETSNPTLRAVFVEDAAALIGLILAAAGIGLHQATGNAVWDAIGSILVGVLLGIVAIFLISRNRDYLTGQAVDDDTQARAREVILAEPAIEAISFLHLEYVGPSRIFLIAAVDITGDLPEHELAVQIQRIEDRLNAHDLIERAILTLSAPGKPGL